jgi:putative tricarboxylic transport membrane protein
MRKLGDLFASLFFIALGIGVTVGGIRLGLGKIVEPEPGFFPFLSGVTLTILSLVLFFQALIGRRAGTRASGKLWRPAAIVMGLVIYVLIFDIAGYILSTVILSVIVLRVLEPKTRWIFAVVSLILAVGSYLLFDRLLGVLLPGGILERFF